MSAFEKNCGNCKQWDGKNGVQGFCKAKFTAKYLLTPRYYSCPYWESTFPDLTPQPWTPEQLREIEATYK